MNYKSIKDLNLDILDWLPRLPQNLDLIVGIPRSGMLVANLMALYLDLPFTDIESFREGRIINAGCRYGGEDINNLLNKKLNILVVDDSLNTGFEMNRIKQKLSATATTHNIFFGAVYVVADKKSNVNYYHSVLPTPRIFEWNIMNHGSLEKFCIDIDGVLCRDPEEYENDDGDKYVHFVRNVHPKIIPKKTIGWLVTCRLEKYRAITEEWLYKNKVKYEKLIMLDLPDKKTRISTNSHSTFKAFVYKETNADLFVESSLSQAFEISRLSGKEVYCHDTREMINPNLINRYIGKSEKILRRLRKHPIKAIRGLIQKFKKKK